MKFRFRRKYTVPFFVFLILVAISIGFYFIGPKFIDREAEFFYQILLISLADSLLIALFVMGLYKVNYYLYHNHLEIHRSLHKNIILNYDQIEELIECKNDTVFLIFGKRPSFKVKYRKGNKLEKYRIRVEKHELLKLVLENEKKIHITKNN